MANNEQRFSEWLRIMLGHGAHNKPTCDAAAIVHDEMWLAQFIADSRFGDGARDNHDLVLRIYDRLVLERRSCSHKDSVADSLDELQRKVGELAETIADLGQSP